MDQVLVSLFEVEKEAPFNYYYGLYYQLDNFYQPINKQNYLIFELSFIYQLIQGELASFLS